MELFVSAVGALLILGLSLSVTAHSEESPFKPGKMEIDTKYLTPEKDGCPLYTTLYYPTKPGYYAPIFFLGGIYDLVSTKHYQTFLEDVAQHGYMVFGIDMFSSDENGTFSGENNTETYRPKSMVESYWSRQDEYDGVIPNFLAQMKWLEKHVNNHSQTKAYWNKLTLSCQSASCSIILNMVQTYPKYAAAVIYLDPVCLNSKKLSPKKIHTKTLSYVSSKSFMFPFCCIKGFGYKRVYDLMTNIKVRMSVKNFGHCGLMEKTEWGLCNKTGVCHCGAEARVREYQLFTAGIMHAFIRWTLYGEEDMRKYIIDETQMPLVLDDLAYDLHPQLAGAPDDMPDDIHFGPGLRKVNMTTHDLK